MDRDEQPSAQSEINQNEKLFDRHRRFAGVWLAAAAVLVVALVVLACGW